MANKARRATGPLAAGARLALMSLKLPSAGLRVGQGYHLVQFGVLGLAASCAPPARRPRPMPCPIVSSTISAAVQPP